MYNTSVTSTSTTWVDGTDSLWISSDSDIQHYSNEVIMEQTGLSPSGDSISYDPEKKRFVVYRGFEYQDKEFTTKRSAKRYLKRWEDKQNGIKTKKVPIYDQYKAGVMAKRHRERMRLEQEEQARIRQEQMDRIRAERVAAEREMVEAAEALRLQEERPMTEEEAYFDRIGIE